MKRLYSLLLVIAVAVGQIQAQNSLSTVPPLNGGNGQSGVSFNLSATGTNLIVDSIHAALYGNTSQQVEIWYNTTAINGAPTISAANGWVLVGTANVSNVTNAGTSPAVLYSLPLNLSILIPAGQTYGFYVGGPSTGTSSVAYSNGGGTNPNSISDGILTITIDANSAFGGSRPNPTFNPRQFNGTIFYTVPSAAPWDASISNLTAGSPCDTITPITAVISNYGDSIINTLTVNWTLNGVSQTPYSFSGTLDTLGGTGSFSSTVTLGSVVTTGSPTYTVQAWVSGPNGNADTVNYNDTALINFAKGLTGTYTIGGPGADYYSYSSALADLNLVGMCGHVTFLVNDSVYNEQVLVDVPSANINKNLTFQSASGDSSLSVITWSGSSSTDNYTLKVNNTHYVTFKGITIENTGSTYKRAVDITSSNNNKFESCVFRNPGGTTSTNAVLMYVSTGQSDNLTLDGNFFDGGSYGLYYYGTSLTARGLNLVVKNNDFKTYYYGIRTYYADNTEIKNNHVSTSATSSSTWYGIYCYYTRYFEVTGNSVIDSVSNGGDGIVFYYSEGLPNKRALVANNFIAKGSPTSTSIITGFDVNSSGHILFAHNNVRIEGTSSGSEAIYANAGNNHALLNNNLVILSPGAHVLYYNTGFDFAVSDYNNLYAPNGNIGYYMNTYQALSDWQNAVPREANSVSTDPGYYSSTDLHTCSDTINGAGLTLAEVTTDIDGDSRSTVLPDIGADEFVGINPGLGPDTSYCVGSTITLGWPSMTGASFIWSTGETTSSIAAGATGTYFVETSSACGTGYDTINISSRPLPVASFTQTVSYLTVTFTNTSTNADSYFWTFGDGTSSTQTNPQHLYTTSGPKTVRLFATNSCTVDTFIFNLNLQIIGITENGMADKIGVYPNPGDGLFNVTLEGAQSGSYTFTVTNLQGQVVNQEVEEVSGASWKSVKDLRGLSSGVYMLNISGPEGSGTARIIVN